MIDPAIVSFLKAAGRTSGNVRLVLETADRRFDVPTRRVLVRLLNENDNGSTEIARWTGNIEELFGCAV